MPSEKSVTWWIGALKEGNEEAARELWQRYFDKLVRLARIRLGTAPRRVADEEDVVLSVFRCLCDGASRGQFSQLTDRDDLWRLLATMTARKAVDQQRRARPQKRGGGQVRGESVFAKAGSETGQFGLDQFVEDEPTPEFLALLAEEHQRLLERLPDETLRRTALWRMEGFTNEEVAEKLGVTARSVERKLQRIRDLWSGEFDP
jgi:DNA-directed RNA polymerase specialized sigma24 family protein